MSWELLLAFKYAFGAGLAVALACSLLSPFVVLKRLAFIGQGISHAGFGGLGLGLLVSLWWAPAAHGGWRLAIVAAFCLLTAVGIGRLSRSAWMQADTAIGIGLVVAMAIGMVSMDVYGWLRPEAYQPDLHGLLFGDVFSATRSACLGAWLVALLTAALLVVGYEQVVFYAFDEEGASVFGVPVRTVHYIFLVLMSLAIVTAMRLVGVVLVTALLVMPGVIGRLVAGRLRRVLIASVLSGVSGMTAGLLLVIWLGNISTGPVVVLVFLGMMVLAAGYRKLAGKRSAGGAA